jgi:uncharacterized membrane protein YgcG
MRKHLLGIVVLASACSGSDTRVVSGHLGRGFPQTATQVKVLQAGNVVATAAVDAQGAFQVAVPTGVTVSLRVVGTGHDAIVFPRKRGAIKHTFKLGAGAPVDIGALHWVGDSSTTKFAFHDSSSADDCDDDGHDSSGATCADDDEDDDEGTCPGGGGGSGSGSGSGGGGGGGSGSGSGSGIGIAKTGGSGSGASSSDDGPDDGDCVGDHDVPDDDACEDDSDDDGSDDDSHS